MSQTDVLLDAKVGGYAVTVREAVQKGWLLTSVKCAVCGAFSWARVVEGQYEPWFHEERCESCALKHINSLQRQYGLGWTDAFAAEER